MTEKKQSDFLTPGTVARMLGVSSSTVLNYLNDPDMERHFIRLPGGHIRIKPEGVQKIREAFRQDVERRKDPLRSREEYKEFIRRIKSETPDRISYASKNTLTAYVNKLLSRIEYLYNLDRIGKSYLREILDDMTEGLKGLRSYIAGCEPTSEELVRTYKDYPEEWLRNILDLHEGQGRDQGEIGEPGPDLEAGAGEKEERRGERHGRKKEAAKKEKRRA